MNKKHKPIIAVSACLLGKSVRYDGGHRRNSYVLNELIKQFELTELCPEVSIGMGIPRPPIKLVGDIDQPKALGVEDQNLDMTQKLEAYSYSTMNKFKNISGVILKKGSPSCGVQNVKVYNPNNDHYESKGKGIFARILIQEYPSLPVIDEVMLNDAKQKQNFIKSVLIRATTIN